MSSQIYFPPEPSPPTPDPLPSQIGEGWPKRAGREHYGSKPMVDEAPLANPQTSLSAATMNLAFWQLGALGLVAPLAVLAFEPHEYNGVEDRAKFAAFTWVDQVLNGQPSSAVTGCTIARNGAGVDFTFPVTALGSDGQQQPITILGADAKPLAFSSGAAPGAHHARVTITGQLINVHVYDSAGGDYNAPFILVVY